MGRKILFITTDQQRYDSLGCNGGTIARTPTVDALARAGVNYRRAYNQNTVCMPARSTMLTGQYVRTHGVVANGVPLPADAPSVAAYLRDKAGYRTALLGKAHFEPGFDLQLQWPENSMAAKGLTGPYRGFEHAELAVHVPAFGERALQHYGRWLIDNHGLEATKGFSPLLAAEPGGETGAPETRINPIPREWYHTDWVADRTIAYLDSLPDDADWFVWMSFPDPHHPWDPPASEQHRCNWRDLDLPPGHPGSKDDVERVLAQKPAHWLGAVGRHVRQRRRRSRVVPPAERHRRQHPRDQRDGPHHERADRRGVRPRASPRRGPRMGRRHRRLLHDRPRRAAGRLRPDLQGPVPHRLADAAADGLAAGAGGGRRRRQGDQRAGRPTRSRADVLRDRRGAATRMDAGRTAADRPGSGRERVLCEWDSQFPGYGMHLRSIYRDGWLCTAYEPSTVGEPNGLEEFFAATGMFGGGIGPVSSVAYDGTEGELYDVEGDPHQWENRWDDPACKAVREDLVADLYDSLPEDRTVLKVERPA